RYAARLPQREIDVARRPPETERRRADTDADRAVRAIGAAVRIGAGDELSRHDESLLREIEMEDAVARCCVIRLLEALRFRERAADARLPLVVFAAGENEMMVGDRGLPWRDRVAAGDPGE